ncbi:MAG: hypothetical protein Q7T77_09070 [Sulfuricurvum sp.]|nr:hypothetical protein [Sulfuricurvum sp.]
MNLSNVLEYIFTLATFDPSFSKEKYAELKSNKQQFFEKKFSQNDYLAFFQDFPLIQSVIKILFNYEYMLNEFENGKHPLFENITRLKKHPKKLDTIIGDFERTLEVSRLLSETNTCSGLERTIKIFKAFKDNPSELISKLYFFEIINSTMEDKSNQLIPIILQYNPFNDSTLISWEYSKYYLEMLNLFDGFDISADMLLISTSIKLHKLFELIDPLIYTKRNNPRDSIYSIFEHMGKEPRINFDRLRYIYPKTFYKGIALFDYSDVNVDYQINEYIENALQKSLEYSLITDRINKIETKDYETYNQILKNFKYNTFMQLLNF